VLKDIQFDPVTDKIVHFDLQGVSKDEVIEVDVPIILIGNPEGVRSGGVLEQMVHKLIIKCLPKDMPQHLEIKVDKLALNESLHAKDLKFDNLEIANSPETVIAAVVTPRAQAEDAAGEEVAKEPEVITKGKTEKEEE
jgi:large subunit ribosomal protein L25